MIPNNPDSREKLDFIFHDWTSLVRVDLPDTLEENVLEDARQKKTEAIFAPCG